MNFSEVKSRTFEQHPEVKEAYDDLAPLYSIIRAEIESRRAAGMTQKDLAKRMGTAQANEQIELVSVHRSKILWKKLKQFNLKLKREK